MLDGQTQITYLICGEALYLTLLQRRHYTTFGTKVYYLWLRVPKIETLQQVLCQNMRYRTRMIDAELTQSCQRLRVFAVPAGF